MDGEQDDLFRGISQYQQIVGKSSYLTFLIGKSSYLTVTCPNIFCWCWLVSICMLPVNLTSKLFAVFCVI